MRKLLLVVPFLMGGWCGPSGPLPPEMVTDCVELVAPSQSTLEMSAAGGPFTPLTASSTLRMDRGFQGGQHVLISVRVFSSTPSAGTWSFETKVTPDGGETLTNYSETTACNGGWTELQNLIAQVDQTDRTSARITVLAQLTSNEGVMVDSIEATILIKLLPPT